MLKKLLIVPAVALGVLGVVLLVRSRKAPPAAPPAEVVQEVWTLVVPKLEVQPRAIGYGVVRAGRVWHAVSQVGGSITTLHPGLREGSFVEEKAELVVIDKTDYALEVAVGEARLEALNEQLAELDARRVTLEASLGIERRSLALAQAEFERIRSLVASESLAPADADREERTVLGQELRVQELENALHLLGPQRKVLASQVLLETSNIAKATLAVDRTVIKAPFDGRIGPVALEKNQVVQPGQALFTLDAIDVAEVTGQAPMHDVRRAITAGAAEIEFTELSAERLGQIGLSATVRLRVGPVEFEWAGDVVRVRGIDPQTRTVGIDVAVADPYSGGAPGRRPPLVPGLYVEVEVAGRVQSNRVVIPRSALHEDRVYLVGADRRLVRRSVVLDYVQSGFAVVKSGLEGGEILVISDLAAAAEGMLLGPNGDAAALEMLRADAAGETSVR